MLKKGSSGEDVKDDPNEIVMKGQHSMEYANYR